MRIEHIAIWVKDIEITKNFYCKYFKGISNDKYTNASKGFSSYFISFNSGSRLEIMHSESMNSLALENQAQRFGLIHFAMSVGSKNKVDQLTQKLKADGYEIVGQPRTTGDGYYESCVRDPEGNIIEITI